MRNKKYIRIFSTLLAVMLCFTAFSVPASARANDSAQATPAPAPSATPGEPLDGETELYTRDLLYDKDAHKQFITVQDREGNTFYIIIDYDKPVDEDEEQYATYFLNPVDAADLTALTGAEEEPPAVCTCGEKCAAGAVDVRCPVCATDMTACTGKAPAPVETPEPTPAPEPEPESPVNLAAVAALLLVLAIGGALAYVKLIRPKAKAKAAPDPDDFALEDEDGPEWEDGDAAPDAEETEDGGTEGENE